MDERRIEQRNAITAMEKCMGPCIPTPNVSGATLLKSSVNLMEVEDMDLLVNEAQEWEDVEFEVALDS